LNPFVSRNDVIKKSQPFINSSIHHHHLSLQKIRKIGSFVEKHWENSQKKNSQDLPTIVVIDPLPIDGHVRKGTRDDTKERWEEMKIDHQKGKNK
jgi:hypothetical protein